MPKDTFNNLIEDKKRTIFDAAVQEFSKHCFSKASINQIVKTAGIPRGSFYQYFKDKEDIYLYMFAEMTNEDRIVMTHVKTIHLDADTLETFIYKTIALLELGMTKPEFKQIIMLMEKDNSEFITSFLDLSVEDIERVNKMIDKKVIELAGRVTTVGDELYY